jgi:hypothetical protein
MEHKVYWYLCFYSSTSGIGLYGSDKGFTKPHQDQSSDLKGSIVQKQSDYLELFVLNPYTNVKTIYRGTIKDDSLYLQYFQEDKPQEVYADVFEYIGTGETTG